MGRHLEGHRRHLLIALGTALLLQLAFVTCYVVALSHPKPHEIPVAVVGAGPSTGTLIERLEGRVGSALDVRSAPTLGAAREAIDDQDIYAAIVPGGEKTTLYTAGAAGATIARVFEREAPVVARALGQHLETVDLKPLPAKDPNGLVVFYLALGCVIYGHIGALLAAQAAPVPPRIRVAALGSFSLASGLLLSLLVCDVLDALPTPFYVVAGIAALTIFTATLITTSLLHVIRPLAMPLAVLILVILGNSGSGGAVAPDLLPGFFRFTGHWLPPGAAVTALRDTAYFPGHEHVRSFLVLGAWALTALVILLWHDLPRGRRPRGKTA
ncbi:MAG: hypothetical protein ACJ762_16070 [Solirubrobacteraceae bacterium]